MYIIQEATYRVIQQLNTSLFAGVDERDACTSGFRLDSWLPMALALSVERTTSPSAQLCCNRQREA